MAAAIELPYGSVTAKSAEEIYKDAKHLESVNALWAVSKALRIVRSREPKTMLVMEQMANVLDKMNDSQRGETQRSADRLADQKAPVYVQAFAEAYRSALMGEPEPAFGYLYAACARYAGWGLT